MIDIKGYENIYAIDRDGRVWSYKSKKYIKQWIANTGYYMVRLHKMGSKKTNAFIEYWLKLLLKILINIRQWIILIETN